jgi:hypothetical protein
MMAMGPTTSEELRSQSITLLKMLWSLNSYKIVNQNSRKYDQLHIMTNYLTKYESFRTNELRGVVITKYNYIENV